MDYFYVKHLKHCIESIQAAWLIEINSMLQKYFKWYFRHHLSNWIYNLIN